jgi:hypothetical protein
MSTVDQASERPHGRVFQVFGGAVPVSAAVAGVVKLDGETYADGSLSDRELLAHARSELMRARAAGVQVLCEPFKRNRLVRARRARLALGGLS